jgi:hypothetical protein
MLKKYNKICSIRFDPITFESEYNDCVNDAVQDFNERKANAARAAGAALQAGGQAFSNNLNNRQILCYTNCISGTCFTECH